MTLQPAALPMRYLVTINDDNYGSANQPGKISFFATVPDAIEHATDHITELVRTQKLTHVTSDAIKVDIIDVMGLTVIANSFVLKTPLTHPDVEFVIELSWDDDNPIASEFDYLNTAYSPTFADNVIGSWVLPAE